MSVATSLQPGPATPTTGPVIVVGYDGSPEAKLAVGIAGERAGPDGTVVAIHVTPAVASWVGGPYDQRALEWAHEANRRALDELFELDTGFATIEPDVFEGDPAETLVRIARLRNAREIVVGSRGRGRIRSLLGSVSSAVLEEADRPVVVVPRAALAADG